MIQLPDPEDIVIHYARPPKFFINLEAYTSHEPSIDKYKQVYNFLHDPINIQFLKTIHYEHGITLASLMDSDQSGQLMSFSHSKSKKTSTLNEGYITISDEDLTQLNPIPNKTSTFREERIDDSPYKVTAGYNMPLQTQI